MRGDYVGVMDDTYAADRKRKKHLIFRYRVRARAVEAAAKQHLDLTKPLRILDFGSADGLTLLELSQLIPNATYLGIEYSEKLIISAPKLPKNIRIIKGDVMDLPKEAKHEPYDLVTALAVLEHLPDPQKAVNEAADTLRPGGIFVATCPHPFWEKASTKLGFLKDDQHTTELNMEKMSELALKAGLEVLSRRPFMWAPTTLTPYLGVTVPPQTSLKTDQFLASLRILDWSFTNQCITARKPLNKKPAKQV